MLVQPALIFESLGAFRTLVLHLFGKGTFTDRHMSRHIRLLREDFLAGAALKITIYFDILLICRRKVTFRLVPFELHSPLEGLFTANIGALVHICFDFCVLK